jgi:hypothetical protein
MMKYLYSRHRERGYVRDSATGSENGNERLKPIFHPTSRNHFVCYFVLPPKGTETMRQSFDFPMGRFQIRKNVYETTNSPLGLDLDLPR